VIRSRLRSRLVVATAMLALATGAAAQERPSVFSTLIDPEDGYLDASALLARGGFIPVPIIITEPAVGGGFGLAGYFVRMPPPGSDRPPTRTIIGGARTGNDSRGAGILRSGSLGDGAILYTAAVAAGTINLDFYPFGGNAGVSYTNPSRVAYLQARTRIGDSGFSAGASAIYRKSEVSFTGDRFPRLAERLSRDTTLSALGFELHYDDRDNPLTPRDGVNALLSIRGYDEAWGSDEDFTSVKLFGAAFRSRGDWTLGAMADAESVTEEAPFFMHPSVDLRGVPYDRYQGGRALSTELEVRRRFHPRWTGLGFVGYGRAESADSAIFANDASVVTGGVGFRYRIARKLGLDLGVDVARGPEDTIFYIQFGHAWGRDMD
jgi:hypothetical protein